MRIFGMESVYLQRNLTVMKKALFAILAAAICLGANAQQLRTNYRSGGFTHVSTEYEPFKLADIPASARVELVQLPDGAPIYLIYMLLEGKGAVIVPKGVKLSATLSGGKIVRLDQIGQGQPGHLKYAAQPSDMELLCGGIKSVDIVTGWNPEDFFQASFQADELSKLFKSHCQAITEGLDGTIELTAKVAGRKDNQNSVLTSAEPIVARGETMDYNVILSHLYYKNTGEEDVDLAFVLGTSQKYHVTYDAPVVFTLRDGSSITLAQARDDVNFVYVYPSLDDLRRMAVKGVAAISIQHEDGVVEDTIPESGEDFSTAVNQQLQLLLSISGRN